MSKSTIVTCYENSDKLDKLWEAEKTQRVWEELEAFSNMEPEQRITAYIERLEAELEAGWEWGAIMARMSPLRLLFGNREVSSQIEFDSARNKSLTN